MADLLEMSSRKTEYRDTVFLKADSPEELAALLIEAVAECGFRPLAEGLCREADAGADAEEIRRSLEEAPLIFAGGRGLHTRENLEKLQRLAALYGAEYAVSRPLVLEGFAPQARMIGITGAFVKPRLLFAAGISIQFMGGAAESRNVIALNSNYNSQIFRYADKAALCDAGPVLDAMLKQIEAARA